jgi:hypothetical protein
LLDQYAQFGAFAFRTKAETSNENRRLQRETHTAEQCETREIHVTPSTVHPAENDNRLPEAIRGGHYIHFRHFCAVMGCEHAPYCKIQEKFGRLGDVICPFPILHKDTLTKVEEIIQSDLLLVQRTYTVYNYRVASLWEQYKSNHNALLYGNGSDAGYPVSEVLQAVAYVIADDNELLGKRPKGYAQIVEHHLEANSELCVEFRRPELLTPLIVAGNERAAMIGAKNPTVYQQLVTISPENEYKLIVRQITEEDLRNAR